MHANSNRTPVDIATRSTYWCATLTLFAAFLVFLLAFADDFRFSRRLRLDLGSRSYFFLHDTDGGNHCFGRIEYFNSFINRNVGNVQHVMDAEVANIHVDHVGNLPRLTTNFYLANDLLQDSLMLSDAKRLAHEMHGHSDFNLLSLDQSRQICMN